MSFKSKRPESPKAPNAPKAGQTIPLVTTIRTVEIRDNPPAANQVKRGKLEYLAGPAKPSKKRAKPVAATQRVVEQRSVSIGRFIGNGEQITAFVMLDSEEVPQQAAANE